MYVTEPGSHVRKDGGRLEVTKHRESIASTRLIDVSQLCIYGNVQVSTQLIRELMAREIPVMWFSGAGWFQGITEGLPGKNVELRRRQYRVADAGSLEIARSMIEGKIRNSRTILRRNTRDRDRDVLESLRRLASKASKAADVAQLLGYEGTAARLYFGQFPTMLRGPESLPGGVFNMAGRNRRPPTDPINCLLSYCYSLLVKDCVATLRSLGFDPYLGFLHRPRFGRPALALDLAEELRPVIAESVVLTVVNNGEVRPSHFVVKAGGVSLTLDGRRAVLAAHERRMETEIAHPIFEYKATWRRIIEVQARLLAALLMGEIDSYPPMIVR
ncbi:MAG: CRISPR-associated endonuclease Cas1 [Actinobacteria bacterium]|nr:CRISPR-associated endonuclease Cas1 [Actinomycetota bacterium]